MGAGTKFLLRNFLFFTFVVGGIFGMMMAFIGVTVVLIVMPFAAIPEFALIYVTAILLGAGLVWGASMGVFFVLPAGGWHIIAVRRQGFPITNETLKVRQQRQLIIDLPFADTFTLCQAAVGHLKRSWINEEKTDYATGEIVARKGMSWWSWGESIHFKLQTRADGRTDVDIECRPVIRGVRMDLGINLGNMNALIGFLVSHSVDLEEPSLDQNKITLDSMQTEVVADEGRHGIALPMPIQPPLE